MRVFEPRYLDMGSRWMKGSEPFGVLLIADGPEVAGKELVVRTQAIGTLATIRDWYQGTDGLLGITAVGEQRFRLGAMTRQDDGLNIGEVELLEPDADLPLPKDPRTSDTCAVGVLSEGNRE